MKVLSLLVLFIICSKLAPAQSILEGQVIDKTTQERISSVTVALSQAKISKQTNAQGYFRLETESATANDTLVFSSVGYNTLLIPVSGYRNNSIVSLQPSNESLEQVNVTKGKLKTERLNGFDLGKVKRDRGYTPQPFTSQFAYAKLFTIPQQNVFLSAIELGRTVFDDPEYPLMPLVKTNPYTKFLVHILSVNPKSGLPDKLIFTKQVSLEDNSRWVTIDLTKDGIVIGPTTFFIAIEWLRIPYNELFQLEWAPRVRVVRKSGKQIYEDVSMYKALYQPALVTYESKNGSPSYTKQRQGNWVPYLDRDVAFSAIIKY